MSIEAQLEREEQALQDQLNDGVLSIKEYNEQMREVQREARECEREERDNFLRQREERF